MQQNSSPNKEKSTNNVPQQQVSFSFNAPSQQQFFIGGASQQQQAVQQNYNSFVPQQQIQSQQIQSSNVLPPQFPQQQQYIPQQQYQQQQFIPQQQYQQQQFIAQQQFPIQYQNQNMNIVPAELYLGHHHLQASSLTLLNKKEEDKEKEVVAVIVTLNSGGSYDHLFATVEQKSQEGTKVLVYEASTSYIEKLIQTYEGNPADDVAKEMMAHINKLHPDCVVFNWECCGAYGSKNFPQGKQHLFKFLRMIIDKGHMAMFSDFSLKALISDWDESKLGPNPFFLSGQTSNPIVMKFNPGDLKECPSAQLQIIGEMAEGGTCHIDVMGGTIIYSVKNDNLNHEAYKLKVLSVSTGTLLPGTEKQFASKVGEHVGTACHVLLTYPSGGMILTSMGHWIELMKVDTSEKKLFEVAEQNFGVAYAQQMKMEYGSLDTNQQKAWVSKNAVSFVQNQAPCSNMSKKMKN